MAFLRTFEAPQKRENNLPVFSKAIHHKPLILVVEDHDDSRCMLKQLLESWGYDVAEAKDGVEAVRKARRERFDLILMDVKLPRLDGFAATKQIRQHNAFKQLPIIFLSACAELAFQTQAEAAGGNNYLIKPLGLLQLRSLLEEHLKEVTPQNVLFLKGIA